MNKFRILGVQRFTLRCDVASQTNFVLHDIRNWGKAIRPQNDAAMILWLPSFGNTSNYTCKTQGLPIPIGACSEIPCSTNYPKPARVVLLTFPGSSWFQSMKLQNCITLHLHENWMQFLKQHLAGNCFWSPYKECYQDATRWVCLFSGTVQWYKILQKPTICTIILH